MIAPRRTAAIVGSSPAAPDDRGHHPFGRPAGCFDHRLRSRRPTSMPLPAERVLQRPRSGSGRRSPPSAAAAPAPARPAARRCGWRSAPRRRRRPAGASAGRWCCSRPSRWIRGCDAARRRLGRACGAIIAICDSAPSSAAAMQRHDQNHRQQRHRPDRAGRRGRGSARSCPSRRTAASPRTQPDRLPARPQPASRRAMAAAPEADGRRR